PESIQRLERAKGITSFETEVVGVSHQVITNTIEIIEFMLQVVPKAEPEVWLRKQQLIQGEKPTVCGVLLFADEPQAILPKRSGVKIYRYRTVEGSGARDTLDFDPITVEGTSYKQIRAAVEQTIKVIQDIPVAGRLGLEAVKYPTDTIHEIVTNAVIHRDYSIADDIHVRIFDNRVEVESPGRLPAHVTPENILDERFARNGNLVRLLNKYPTPPNKDVGEGLNTAFEAMRKLGLKEPIIQNREHSVLVTIRHERLASAEEVILEYLEKQDSITNKKARGLCHFDADHKVRRIFQRLEDWKLIEKVPGTQLSTTAYRKGAKFKEWRSRLSSKTRT
ncbi:MAG TPA: ATP-binding protein, partial [Planctomycetota bacterium]|nr:ATP-binding protein [Planctomycetota bacterium]